MTTGIHHVTAITRDVQRNVDFYTGFLGLKLVKQTGGYEDGEQLHLFYGDRLGSPGSLFIFLVWQDGAPGRVGLGQVSEIAFAIPPKHLGDWLQKAMAVRPTSKRRLAPGLVERGEDEDQCRPVPPEQPSRAAGLIV